MDYFFSLFTEFEFLRNAAVAALLSAVACGITGSFVVIKKISYIGGGISHAVLGGIGAAYFLRIEPLYGALAFSLLAAVFIGMIKLRFRQHEDTAISALWAGGMAVGILFAYLTPGYNVDLLSFLFGNILMVTTGDLWLLLVLDLIIVFTVIILFRQLLYVSFDEEYAYLRGINVDFIYLTLLSLIALTVVILVQTVGLILVIALLTIPSAIAFMFSKNIFKIILFSILLIFILNLAGLAASFIFNIPSGASIILATVIVYSFSFLAANKKRA